MIVPLGSSACFWVVWTLACGSTDTCWFCTSEADPSVIFDWEIPAKSISISASSSVIKPNSSKDAILSRNSSRSSSFISIWLIRSKANINSPSLNVSKLSTVCIRLPDASTLISPISSNSLTICWYSFGVATNLICTYSAFAPRS